MANHLSLNTQTDIVVILSPGRSGIRCQIKSEENEFLFNGQKTIIQEFAHIFLEESCSIGFSPSGKGYLKKNFNVYSKDKTLSEKILCSFTCEKDRE